MVSILKDKMNTITSQLKTVQGNLSLTRRSLMSERSGGFGSVLNKLGMKSGKGGIFGLGVMPDLGFGFLKSGNGSKQSSTNGDDSGGDADGGEVTGLGIRGR